MRNHMEDQIINNQKWWSQMQGMTLSILAHKLSNLNMKSTRKISLGLIIGFSLLSGYVVAGDDSAMRNQLFSQVDASFKAAKKAGADILSPEYSEKAIKYYRGAEKRFSQNKGIDDIKEYIYQSESYLRKAMEATRIAELTFASVIQARSDAISADAAKYATDAWTDAESQFRSAALKLEGGSIKGAKKAGAKAEPMFRTAELTAVKENYLSGARNLIERAKKIKADRFAPKTLANAENLLKSAEIALTQNRYDTDKPRDLAKQAKNEGKHAITITEIAVAVKEKSLTVEDVVKRYEKPLSAIAGEMNLVATLHNGYKETEQDILKEVDKYQKRSTDLSQCDILMEEMTVEVAKLEKQLGVKSNKLEAEARIREHLARIENLFDRDEAQIFRQGKSLIIRMVGLSFDSGKFEIKPEHFGLLSKVKSAINMSRNGQIIIEGHTDSYGSDIDNLNLSEHRAEAVVQYFLANMSLNPSRITALGFGETHPIANNETPEGRAKNRRIDVIIKPGN